MKTPIKVWLGRLCGFAVVLVFSGSLYWVSKSRWFEIHRIDIEMDPASTQGVLFQRIKVDLEKSLQAYLGRKAWEVGLEAVLKDVESDSRVKSAFIRRRFPYSLSVQIMPRNPVLVLVGKKGRVYPIASDGSLLPPLLVQEAPDLPLLRGRGFFKREDWRKKVVQLMKQIPQQGEVSLSKISEVHYTPKQGLTFILMGKGIRVSVGDKALRRKADRVKRVLRYLAEHQIDGRVIDARFSKKVVVRLRNSP